MKLRVKLFGTLGELFPDYQHSKGLEVELPDGATVSDLLSFLEIPQSRQAAVAAEGRILGAGDKIGSRAQVDVLQVVHGG